MPDVVTPTKDSSAEHAGRAAFALPYVYAQHHGVLVEEHTPHSARVLHRPGIALDTLVELRRNLRVPIDLVEVSAEEFQQALNRYYEADTSASADIMDDLGEDFDLSDVTEALAEPEDLLESADDAPIIRLINALLTEAVKQNASDIHIEPYEHRLMVRTRVDGVLHDIMELPPAVAPLLVSRIKVMAQLDIAEKRIPQDGRISLRVAAHPVDVRVSTMPASSGERVVLRLLDKQAGRLDLEQLGMAPALRDAVDRLIHRPHGIFLVTGPTGSGKTTTLYAALTRLNDRSRNIVTLEDPIEYYIDGIGQTQVNPKVDLTFARGLRAILRQDPDVVMVGEIRDLETVEIAIRASLTGHVVLSTLHTNSAIGAITRLRDMGVEPFLLSSSMVGILAQRLVRSLCPQCKRAYTASQAECDLLKHECEAQGLSLDNPPTLYAAEGCEHCHQSGYAGRTGIYELVEVDDTLRQLIHEGAGEQALLRVARAKWPSLHQDGARRVLAGDTSIDELVRVTQED